jgi:hypothetical protein
MSWCTQVCADIAQTDETLRKVSSEFAIVTMLVSFGEIAGQMTGASDFNTEIS